MPRVKIIFVHGNVFAIILDMWHIIKILNEINTFLYYVIEVHFFFFFFLRNF